jgi:hypothetical protein
MVPKSIIAATLLATGSVTAMPSALKALGTEGMPIEQVMSLTAAVDRQMLAAFECRGQSCLIADTSGKSWPNKSRLCL